MNLALRLILFFAIVLTVFLSACTSDNQSANALFTLLPANETGITFSNTIEQNDSMNILEYMYFYNGGGVGVGDINNDGLTDIFFSGNMVTSKLYLNKGNFQFEDITQKAGITTKGWCTGVAFVDINNDGYQDIYVSRAGSKVACGRANLLFINNKNNTFTESAAAYGIADTGYTTQAAFFDYDKDGDLDLYLLTHDHSPKTVNNINPVKEHGENRNTDRLYRNNGNVAGGHPTFTNVSAEAGIQIEGYGLGVAISDINADGWPDIYVSNDFVGSDLLYINNRNGTFTNKIKDYLKHESYNGMGVDISDYNNDGHPDIAVMDMLPEDNYRQKMMLGGMTNENFGFMLDQGYEPQYMRNTLQLNDGNGHFSEIAQLAGIDKTDWSWCPLFADFDNDGYKDLFVTNGYLKDITDRDFIVYSHNKTLMQDAKTANKTLLGLMNKQQGVKLPNCVFRNNKNLTFSKAADWGINQPSFSNGAAFADLDNDGDLDLVVNNINDKAFIYRNNSEKKKKNNYLQISLAGDSLNTLGLGTKVTIHYQGKIQFYEQNLYRGYESSVTNVLQFGLGNSNVVDSITLQWTDGKVQQLAHVPVNRRIVVNKKDAVTPLPEKIEKSPAIFSKVSSSKGIRFLHKENKYSDLTSKPLMPRTYSTQGPAMAAGDINGNGFDDFFIGGSAGTAGSFYLQDRSGHFSRRDFPEDIECEDIGALLFDADGDGDLDLYVVSGGSEFDAQSPLYQDRLYKNDGKGNFKKDPAALPSMTASGSCVTAADYDRDGDLDLFVGGRVSPGKYPQAPQSYILENKGGRFTDATDKVCKGLKNIGMITSALWTDFDNDGQVDLIIAGEWMPVTFLKNTGGKFVNVTSSTGLSNTSGWWNSIAGGDFDNDGDIDYILGNLGLNTPFHASADEPLTLVSGDLDQSGISHSILTWYNGGKNYPWPAKDVILPQMPRFGKKFFMYHDYAGATITDFLSPEVYKKASVLSSSYLSSSYLENLGCGKFSLKPLPIQAQFAPVNGIVIRDVDKDGNLDCLLTGNCYAPDVSIGRCDAFTGLYLKGDGKGNFAPVSPSESGFCINTDARSLIQLYSGNSEALIASASNSDSLVVYAQVIPQGTMLLQLQSTDAYGWLTTNDSRKRKLEFYYGSGYLSQSSRRVEIPPEATLAVITDSRGKQRNYSQKTVTTRK